MAATHSNDRPESAHTSMTSRGFLVGFGLGAEQLGRIEREPGVDPLALDARGHLR